MPSAAATMVAKNPMITEFFAAFTHFAFCHRSAHQALSRTWSGNCIPKVSSVSYQRKE